MPKLKFKRRFSLKELQDTKTLLVSQFANLKYEDTKRRVWLSRMTIADGEPYDHKVTVEALKNGCWVKVEEYQATEQIENIKQLWRTTEQYGKQHYKDLYFYQVPLSKLFQSVRATDLKKKDKETTELFLSIKAESGTYFFYVKPTQAFREWLKRNFYYPCEGIEAIQQRHYHSKTKKETWLNAFLVLAEQSYILGDAWLDYKKKAEIEQFFKIKA